MPNRIATTSACPVVVFIGGNGSNLQALINAKQEGKNIPLAAVVSHRSEVYGLQRAQQAHIPTHTVNHSAYSDRLAFEKELVRIVHHYHAQLIVLAGFMRILSPYFIEQFPGKILNVHPSLLPNYKGLHTHQRVLQAKEPQHGISVHFVTNELDGGPLVAKVTFPVLPCDTVCSLTEKAHHAEHWLYPQVVEWFAEQRLKCINNIVLFDSVPIAKEGFLFSLEIDTRKENYLEK